MWSVTGERGGHSKSNSRTARGAILPLALRIATVPAPPSRPPLSSLALLVTLTGMMQLIQPLVDGPVDIVGDVHGEIDALRSLLRRLGYDEMGRHPTGRRLVFVGDLTDRGPDSVAVVDLVRQLVETERAQCVLGNHDFNLLCDHRKHENRWFYGEEYRDENGQLIPMRLAQKPERRRIVEFFATLPLALERSDIRIVHACWDDAKVAEVRSQGDARVTYELHRRRLEAQLASETLDHVDRILHLQNENPVKRITSGPEERAPQPRTLHGKTRYERRVRWWHQYNGTYCVFGHYCLVNGTPRGNHAAFCVDFGVGRRSVERMAGRSHDFTWQLGALRFPERVLVFDESDELNPVPQHHAPPEEGTHKT